MADDDDDVYHPLSPPTSDLPVPEDEMDFRLNMNSGDIRRRYPGIRAFINERRLLCTGVWGLLGLPSCGRVYQDTNETKIADASEIQFVVWPGL